MFGSTIAKIHKELPSLQTLVPPIAVRLINEYIYISENDEITILL